MAGTAGMTQLAQRLGFDLTDALTGDLELLADLLKRMAAAVVQAVAQLDHQRLSGSQRVELALDGFTQDAGRSGICRSKNA